MAIDTVEKIREALHRGGLRATGSRIAVLSLLMRDGRPLSHAEVVEALGPSVADRATLYRNLVDLAEVGLLRRTELGDRTWRFEFIDAEHQGEVRHPHFICTECGSVECLPELAVAAGRAAHTPKALKAGDVEIQIRGVCDECIRI
ncbi:MAG: transcriptional repressor [Deltaproteobacteria bacterium]|nr:transcriptional repressor [Deltaproteobacteria bacterium]